MMEEVDKLLNTLITLNKRIYKNLEEINNILKEKYKQVK